jgi:hypothetical protein
MNPRFRFTVGSEPEYEDLVGDLYFDDAPVCILTQEKGFDAMEVQFLPAPGGDRWHFSLKDFEEALAALKKRMWELRRIEPNGS